ncbi:unnamed protein product [Cercopithifilaria johnstoni]|uniref:Uncharacterized protein n=1 Tax=Cercopithifilaria johnstoni TaxID=2874296 RepID=A0A8J2LYD7_9BILA|nr:unnamed protein product [Cercopithifilaria johnstoni]
MQHLQILNTQEIRKARRNGTVPIRNNVSGEQPIISKLYRKTLPLTGTESSKILLQEYFGLKHFGNGTNTARCIGPVM